MTSGLVAIIGYAVDIFSCLFNSRLSIFAGKLPPRVAGLVLEWATLHQGELLDAWTRAQSRQPLMKIEPLQ